MIELLVVVLIIGVLIAVSAPSFLAQTQKATDSASKQYLTIAWKSAKADAVDNPAGQGLYRSAAALASAINASEPELSVAVGTTSCPAAADTNPKHIFIDPASTSTKLILCNDPTHDVWTLTATNTGPPVFTVSRGISYSSSSSSSGTYATAVESDGPVGYWRLDDGSGTTIADALSAGHTGSYTGGAYTLGQAGATADGDAAVSFNGGWGDISSYSALNPAAGQGLTMEFWYKGSAPVSGNGFIILKGFTSHSAPYYEYGVGGAPSGTVRVSIAINGALADWMTGVSYPTDGLWHYYVVTYDRSAGTLNLYIDGILKATQAQSGDVSGYATDLGLMDILNLGASYANTGQLDEVAIYTKALSCSTTTVGQGCANTSQIGSHYAAASYTGAEPHPLVSSLSPSSVAAGSGGFTLTVNGQNFVSGATVDWDGVALTTSYVSSAQLTATVPAADVNSVGNHAITVVQPQGTTAAATQAVVVAGPQISNLSPSSAIAGSGAFTLTVNGANFTSGSTVYWDGASRTTTFVNSGQLTAAIPASDVASVGNHTVTVQNPGGAASSGIGFAVTTLSYSQVVLADGPVGYWRLDDASGSTISDGLSAGHTGSYTGTYSLNQTGATSDGDKSVFFNGGWGNVSAYSALNPGTSDGLTMEFWYKGSPPAGPNNYALMKAWTTTHANPYYQYGVSNNGGFRVVVNTDGVNFTPWDTGVAWPTDGLYHYIVITYDQSNLRLYVDGVLKAQTARTGYVHNSGTLTPLGLMDILTLGSGYNAVATLDEVAIYNKALTCSTTTIGQSCASTSQIGNHYAAR